MILDSSVVVAIVLGESEADALIEKISAADHVAI